MRAPSLIWVVWTKGGQLEAFRTVNAAARHATDLAQRRKDVGLDAETFIQRYRPARD